MEKEEIEKQVKAGNILWKAQELARKELQPNCSLFEAAEKIEEFIRKKGAECAFPANLSLNENAAHQTPCWNDKNVLQEDDVVKVDIGTHIEGRIADASFTINHSGKWKELVEATELALAKAFSMLGKNPTLGEIGAAIEHEITAKGFRPIQNLTGHGLGEYVQHAPPSIPNIAKNDARKFEEGKAYAIEPFASNGDGFVREGLESGIFMLEEPRSVRNAHARRVLEFVAENYRTLPFAERWLHRELKMDEFALKIGLKQLVKEKIIKSFPVLRERPGAMVSQAENSFIKDKNRIIKLVQGSGEEKKGGKNGSNKNNQK